MASKHMSKSSMLVVVILVLSLASGTASAQQVYRLTNIGSLGGDLIAISGRSKAINASGQVTGLAEKPKGRIHAFRWNGTKIQDLGTLGGASSGGLAINSAGQVTGFADTSDEREHAFLWDRGMQDLGTLGGTSSAGLAINDAGLVTGHADVAGDTAQHAFLSDGTIMADLGTLGGQHSDGIAINALGQVTGWAGSTDGGFHAFLFDGNSMKDLGTFGGIVSAGTAINDSGLVTGYAATANFSRHAFLWDGTRMQDLGTLGGEFSEGLAINSSGQVAGNSSTPDDGGLHAFLWDGESMQDLGTLGGDGSLGLAINAAGQVTGISNVGSGDVHAFLWDGATLHDLNDLVDPADPLKSRLTIISGIAINDAGYVLASGDYRHLAGQEDSYFVVSPATPDDLRAHSRATATGSFVRLAWSDRFPNESKFQIERSPVSNTQCGVFTTIGSVGKNTTVFRDTTVSPNTKYCYQLRVFRSTFVPTLSNIARIRTK
jgi:probable HAF family extracellular repeat protein